MKLARAPGQYDARDQQDMRNALSAADDLNHKKDGHLMLRKGTRIEMFDTNGVRYALTVSTAGALVISAL